MTQFYSEGLIPGVLYGVDENRNVLKVNLLTNKKDILREFRTNGTSLENTLYELELDNDTKHVVTPRQIQFSPGIDIDYFFYLLETFYNISNAVTDEPVSANFLRYWPGNKLRIPFQYINQSASEDLGRDCVVVDVNDYVECTCEGEVPFAITVDLTGAKNRDVIRLSNLKLPPGVRPVHSVSSDLVVAVIKQV